MNPKVDPEKCIGCGSCEMVAPKTFEMNDEMKAVVKPGEHEDAETVKMAADSCPTEAIILEQA